eukprot:CAMPEP_0172520100 /NCGR_PEP_ID=MMETSP1066-20121228/291804_1 /TAXON_ID=671091 /ORGANISM="Coscinodiscus wailesii, Strain CCMP2513" /LENGTH=729 /DNA_ID=CAMNT_0013302799 /DNA_START=129 /DNA_END=2315 /DNA_ORIENTATION=+
MPILSRKKKTPPSSPSSSGQSESVVKSCASVSSRSTTKSGGGPISTASTSSSFSSEDDDNDNDNNNNNANNNDDDDNTSPIRPAHSRSLSFGTTTSSTSTHHRNYLPPLFNLIETLQWSSAENLARQAPAEVTKWATIRTKVSSHHSSGVGVGSDSAAAAGGGSNNGGVSKSKRQPLHHACLKLRCEKENRAAAAECVRTLVELGPEVAGQRESRHGCLPLHLAAFASFLQGGGGGGGASSSSPRSVSGLTVSPPVASSASPRRSTAIIKGLLPSKRDTAPKHKVTFSSSTRDVSATLEEDDDDCSSSPPPPVPLDEESCLVSIVRALLSAYPKGARMDSEGGRLPLHMACSGRACLGVVQEIIAAYPSAARHRTRDGSLPLHLAASWGVSSPEVAVCLLRVYPDAAFGSNRHGRTPLEEALYVAGETGRTNQAELIRALRKHPSFWTQLPSRVLLPPASPLSASERRGRGANCCKGDTDASFTSSTDDESEECGHVGATEDSCSSSSSSPIPRHPTLHLAATTELTILIRSENWPTVTTRLELRPSEAKETLTVTSRSGRTTRFTPLHYALERAPPTEPIEALVEAYHPSLSQMTMPGGQLPLHIACTWGASASVVGFLLAAYPNAAQRRDDVGNLPIHTACYSGSPTAVIESLLCTNPKSVWATNGAGSTPVDIVKRLRHDNRADVLELLKRHMEINMRGMITGKKDEVPFDEIKKDCSQCDDDLLW